MRVSRDVKEIAGGILVGGALGASAGLLAGVFLAPKSGKQLRSEIRKKARRTWDKIEHLV